MKKSLVFALVFLMITAVASNLAALPRPLTLDLTSTSSTIKATWTVGNQDVGGFNLSYNESEGSSVVITIKLDDPKTRSHTITGLNSNTEYDVNISAYLGDEESTLLGKNIVTTNLDVDITLVSRGVFEIDISDFESTVDTYDYYVGAAPMTSTDRANLENLTHEELSLIYPVSQGQNINVNTVSTVSADDGTYYILVKAYFSSDDSVFSPEIAFNVGDFGTFFSQSDPIESGCFIGASSNTFSIPFGVIVSMAMIPLFLFCNRRSRLILGAFFLCLSVFAGSAYSADGDDYKNLFGIKGSYFDPAESLISDSYESIVPVSLFYERMFGRYLSMDISAGFCEVSGNAVTNSGEETGVDADLQVIPISGSVNLNVPVTELITCYLGFGGDFWTFKETSFYGDESVEVGGYHGKLGLKLFTGDTDYFKRGGILVEAAYLALDRFGENEVDLGGWTYSLGVMYCF